MCGPKAWQRSTPRHTIFLSGDIRAPVLDQLDIAGSALDEYQDGKLPIEYERRDTEQHRLFPGTIDESIDRDRYTVRVGTEDIEQYRPDRLRDMMTVSLKRHADCAIEEAIEPVKDELEERYRSVESNDPNAAIRHVQFGDVPSSRYIVREQRIVIDDDQMDRLDLETGEYDDPRLKKSLYHEGMHAVVLAPTLSSQTVFLIGAV